MKKIFATIRSYMQTKVWGRGLLAVINKLQIENVMFFICDLFEPCFNKDDIREARKIFTERKAEIKSMVKNLEDEESRETYKALIMYRMSGKRQLIFKIAKPSNQQYFMSPSERNIILPRGGGIFCGLRSIYRGYFVKFLKNK